MVLKIFDPARDFDTIKNWIDDERTHAMWCASKFAFPLERTNFTNALSDMNSKTGDIPFMALADDGEAAGFLCYAFNSEAKEGMLKFVVVNPAFRGKGIAGELLKSAAEYAFEHGAEMVHLNVFTENVRAKKCYLKAGFVERNTTENAFQYKDEFWGRCNMALYK